MENLTHEKWWLRTYFNFANTFCTVVTYTWTEDDPLNVYDSGLSFIIKVLYWTLPVVLSRFKLFRISEAGFASVRYKRGKESYSVEPIWVETKSSFMA
jgi:hypothetical protein